MLRSFSRAATSSSWPLQVPRARTQLLSRKVIPTTTCLAQCRADQRRHDSTQHAISNPTLSGIEKRWEFMEPRDQAHLWMSLRDRMKVDWHELTMQEKRAAWWIAFGPHGPRAEPHPDEPWWLFTRTLGAMVLTLVLFIIIRQFAREPPRTMNKEWQEATNEYLKSQNTEPITGVSSEGYKGRGMVQSRPRKGPPPENEEE